MRTRWFTGFMMLALFLSACHSPTSDARHMVRRAEQLADTLPDSTVCLIDSVLRMPVSFSERERMDMALLQGEALFRDVPLDDDFEDSAYRVATSPELERAADYYAGKKQYAKAAHAALYSGYVQQHYNEKEAAMRSYKAAEQYGLLSNDSLTAARAEFRMGKMLYYEGRKQEALSSFTVSRNHIGNRAADLTVIENGKGAAHIMLNQFDSAELCFRQSYLYAEKSRTPLAKHKALNNFSVLYRLQGEYEKAVECLQQISHDTCLSSTEVFMSNLNLGNVFFDMKEMDSAASYYRIIERSLSLMPKNKEMQLATYDALYKFAEREHNDSLALLYRKKHEDVLYDIMLKRQEQALFRIKKQYDYETMQNAMSQKLMRRHRIIIILGALAILGLIAFALSRIRLARMRKLEAEANANLFHFMQQNKALVESNMVREKEMLDTTQRLSDMLYARLRAMQQLDYCLKNPIDKIALKDLEHEVFGSGDHWEAVKEVLVALYPGLWESLKLKYPEMDEMELRVCMLSRLKLSRLAEATLLGISTSVLDKLRTKVRKVMMQDETQ